MGWIGGRGASEVLPQQKGAGRETVLAMLKRGGGRHKTF